MSLVTKVALALASVLMMEMSGIDSRIMLSQPEEAEGYFVEPEGKSMALPFRLRQVPMDILKLLEDKIEARQHVPSTQHGKYWSAEPRRWQVTLTEDDIRDGTVGWRSIGQLHEKSPNSDDRELLPDGFDSVAFDYQSPGRHATKPLPPVLAKFFEKRV